MTADELRQELSAKIKDAYYEARDNGGTMHTAADDAARAVLDSGLVEPTGDLDATMQEDLAALLRALGLGDHARPCSPHEVVIGEVLPAIERLTAPATCSCTPHPYGEGPEPDCPIHGALWALNEVNADLAAARRQLDQIRELCTPEDSVVTYGTRRPALYMSDVMAILDGVARGGRGAAPADEPGGAT